MQRVFPLLAAVGLWSACGNEVQVTFVAQPMARLSSLRVGIKQADVTLFDDSLTLDGGVVDLPASLRVLVKNEQPLTIRADAVDLNDQTRTRSVTSGPLRRVNTLEIDLSDATVCPPPPPRSNEVVLFDDAAHDRDEFTYFSGPPRHVTQACSGAVALELVTNDTNDGIGLYVGRQQPAGVRYRRLSLRLWASRVGNVELGVVAENPSIYFWLPTRTSVHEIGPSWRSFAFDLPDDAPASTAIHVHLAGMPTPVTLRLDDVRIVPR
ncbi:MAG: hypothetical protein GQE15_43240 [Archangiaceae bacterium]|nr:hypothetical protein [Archangiaceae bacterium]